MYRKISGEIFCWDRYMMYLVGSKIIKMKEIRMDYTEYEDMVRTIETQSGIIDEFKKESRVVLVDERFRNSCPRIIANESLAKEYLQEEFEHLSKELWEMKQALMSLHNKQKLQEKPKKSLWSLRST